MTIEAVGVVGAGVMGSGIAQAGLEVVLATRRAPRALGIHFMNPVPHRPVVELIRGPDTDEGSLAISRYPGP